MANLAIKGHATRGKEVIEILEMLGGNNRHKYVTESDCFGFFIGNETTNKTIYYKWLYNVHDEDVIFTLEEFLDKYPYKIGDRVRVPEYESEVRISKMYWDGNEVQYEVVTDEVEWYSAKELNEFNEPTKKETVENIVKIDIPKGYEFAGVDDDKHQVIFEKIGYHYPKTYEECCEILKVTHCEWFGYLGEVLVPFQKLLICRDAYWKIAGEQMGLGKSWMPDWGDSSFKYCLKKMGDNIEKSSEMTIGCILAFPITEMRDAFYEHFKDLIEQCKELL